MADTSRPVLIDGKLLLMGPPLLSSSRPTSAAQTDSDSSQSSRSSSSPSSRLASPVCEETVFQPASPAVSPSRAPGPLLPRPDIGSGLAAGLKKGGSLCSCGNRATYRLAARVTTLLVAVSLYNAYLIYAIHYHVSGGRPLDWCGGLGFLIVLTLLVYLGLFYFHVVKRCVWHYQLRLTVPARLQRLLATRLASVLATLTVTAAIVVFLVLDSSRDRYRCASHCFSI